MRLASQTKDKHKAFLRAFSIIFDILLNILNNFVLIFYPICRRWCQIQKRKRPPLPGQWDREQQFPNVTGSPIHSLTAKICRGGTFERLPRQWRPPTEWHVLPQLKWPARRSRIPTYTSHVIAQEKHRMDETTCKFCAS